MALDAKSYVSGCSHLTKTEPYRPSAERTRCPEEAVITEIIEPAAQGYIQ